MYTYIYIYIYMICIYIYIYIYTYISKSSAGPPSQPSLFFVCGNYAYYVGSSQRGFSKGGFAIVI